MKSNAKNLEYYITPEFGTQTEEIKLGKGVTSLTPIREPETVEYSDYAGDGTVEELEVSVKQGVEGTCYYGTEYPISIFIREAADLESSKRTVILRKVDKVRNKQYTGKARINLTADAGGESNAMSQIEFTINFTEEPVISDYTETPEA